MTGAFLKINIDTGEIEGISISAMTQEGEKKVKAALHKLLNPEKEAPRRSLLPWRRAA